MASTGGSHGIARTIRKRTEEQRQQDLEKIEKYRALEDEIREKANQDKYADSALLDLTTKLLRLNPEYYTIWNVRRRCLTSGSLSKPSAGSSRSRASPSTSAGATTRWPSETSSPSPSAAIPRHPRSRTPTKAGSTGITAEEHTRDEGSASPTIQSTETLEKQGPTTGHAPESEQTVQDIANDTAIIQSELNFTVPLLIDFPKCYWIWNHRRYILSLSISRLPSRTARDIWTAELALVSKMLNKDQRNFHAWSYRRQVVERLESAELDGTSMAESEFAYTTVKIKANLSNFSAWHNRSRLVLRILDERGADDEARRRFMEDELAWAREGLNVGPEDQSLWYYHQFLMSHLLDYVGRPTMAPKLPLEERIIYVEREIEEIRDLLEDYDDIKWIYEALLEYSMALEGLKREHAVSAGDQASRDEIKGWLEKLRQLDPLRSGRWDDLEMSI